MKCEKISQKLKRIVANNLSWKKIKVMMEFGCEALSYSDVMLMYLDLSFPLIDALA